MESWQVAALAVACALVAGGCAGTTLPAEVAVVATPTAIPTEPPTPTPEPTPTAPAVESESLELPADADFVYGNVNFALLSLVVSNEDPVSRGQGLGLPSASRYLYVDLGVMNPSAVAALSVNDRDFLHLASGGDLVGTQLQSDDIVPRSIIQPGATGSYTAAFDITSTAELVDARLLVGSSRSEQLSVALSEVAEASRFEPSTVAVGATAEVNGGVVCGESTLRATVASVHYALDVPADIGSVGGLPRRADRDHVFAELEVDVEVLDTQGAGAVGGQGGCVGTIVSDDLVQLLADGLPLEARYVEGDASVEAIAGDTVRLTVGFMPRQDSSLVVRLGNPEGQTADINLG